MAGIEREGGRKGVLGAQSERFSLQWDRLLSW